MTDAGDTHRDTHRDAAHARHDAVGGVLVALAALQFGVVILFGKQLTDGPDAMPVEAMLAVRFAVAAVVMAAALAALRRPLLAARGERRGLALLSVFGYGVEATFFFLALQHGTAAAVTLLFFLYPVIVALGAWLAGLGTPGRMTVVALACAIVGAITVVVTGAGLEIDTLGVVFALVSAATYSGYLIAADIVLRRTQSLTSGMWVSGGAAIGLLGWAVATDAWRLPVDGRGWWLVVGMGVATAGAFVCLMEGIQRIGALRTSIVSALEPLAASLLAWVVLGERVTGGVALGGTLILAGAITASLSRRARPQEQQIT